MIPIFIGYDPRESVGFYVLCHSILENTEAVVSITPLTGYQFDATNRFSYERWKIPALCNYRGWALYMESDMVLRPGADLEEVVGGVFHLRDTAVALVPHDYRTKFDRKYFNQPNRDYPRKNWSSFMLINCAHAAWQRDLPWTDGAALHRFSFLRDDQIAVLPRRWNHLVGEYAPDPAARLLHFTIGIPPLWTYGEAHKDECQEWYDARTRMLMAYE
jgi:hypothetical protein